MRHEQTANLTQIYEEDDGILEGLLRWVLYMNNVGVGREEGKDLGLCQEALGVEIVAGDGGFADGLDGERSRSGRAHRLAQRNCSKPSPANLLADSVLSQKRFAHHSLSVQS